MYDYLLSEPRIKSRYEILTLVSLFFFFPSFWGGGGEEGWFVNKNSCHQILIVLCSRVPFNTTKGVTQTHKKTCDILHFGQFVCLVFCGAAAQCGPRPPHSWGFLITHNDASQSVVLLWTSDQLVAETSTWQHITLTTSMLPVGFKTMISASERLQTHALDRAATGTGYILDSRDTHPNTTMSVKLTYKGHLFHIAIQTGTWCLPSCWSWRVVHAVSYWSERLPCLLPRPLHPPPLRHH